MVWKILKEPIDYEFLKKHETKIVYDGTDSHLKYIGQYGGRDIFHAWFTNQPEREINSVEKSYAEDELELMNLAIAGKINRVVKAKFDDPKKMKGYNVNIRKMF